MKATEANKMLIETIEELIVKMNAQANKDKIMAMVDKYINECASNSPYDQVSNINTLIGWYKKGDIKGFLGAIQYCDTLTHINKI